MAYSVWSQRHIGRMTTGATKPILKPLVKLLPKRPTAPKWPTVARQITVKYEAVDREAGTFQGLSKQCAIIAPEVHETVRTTEMR